MAMMALARRELLGLVAVMLVVGCTVPPAAGVPSSSQPEGPSSQVTPDLPDAVVDIDLVPVSRSRPGQAAQEALDLCVRPGELSRVVGMAALPSARDVGKYMLSNGKEPELQDDSPVWLVQFEGELTYRFGTVFHPTCMVKDGERTLFMAYGGRQDGSAWYPPADFVRPILALPPLAP